MLMNIIINNDNYISLLYNITNTWHISTKSRISSGGGEKERISIGLSRRGLRILFVLYIYCLYTVYVSLNVSSFIVTVYIM